MKDQFEKTVLGEEESPHYRCTRSEIAAIMTLKQEDLSEFMQGIHHLHIRNQLCRLAETWDNPKDNDISFYFGKRADLILETIYKHHRYPAGQSKNASIELITYINNSLSAGIDDLAHTAMTLKALHSHKLSINAPIIK